jgi:hypothetical protein
VTRLATKPAALTEFQALERAWQDAAEKAQQSSAPAFEKDAPTSSVAG